MSTASAAAAFASLSPADQGSHVFGKVDVNTGVAWFCYNYVNPDNYTITGATTVDRSVAMPDDTITWTHQLTKAGIGSPTVSYTIQRSNVVSGSPQTYNDVTSGSWTPGTTTTMTSPYTVLPSDVGHQICERIKWSPTAYNNSGESSTAGTCVTIGLMPIVHIMGNDLRVGSGFTNTQNSLSTVQGSVRASGASLAEYGVLAPGMVAGFASQVAGLSGTTAPQATWSQLTFANTNNFACSTGFGCYTSALGMGTIPNVYTFLTNASSGVTKIDKGSANISTSSLTIPGYNLSDFKGSVVVYTTGTITIDSDIKYTQGSLQKDTDIPQLVLIADNININNNVKQVDAWLIARGANGTINTCSDVVQTALRIGNCNNQLQINGPLMASELMLDRTAYNSAKSSDSAETVNLRGDAYIWANRLSRSNATWQTTYVTDLPPRY